LTVKNGIKLVVFLHLGLSVFDGVCGVL